jgi:hypothetical protein
MRGWRCGVVSVGACALAGVPAARGSIDEGARAVGEPDRVLLYERAFPRVSTPNGVLTTSFSRPVGTVSPLGEAVGVDEPRYDQAELMAGVPVVNQLTFGDTSFADFLAVGQALDGSPLFVVRRTSNLGTRVEVWNEEPAGSWGAPTMGSLVQVLEDNIVLGARAPFVDVEVTAASVYEGAVVLSLNMIVSEDPARPGAWPTGNYFGVSVGTHGGAGGWTDALGLVYSDAVTGLDPTWERGREWQMVGPFSPTRGGSAGEVWFSTADYRNGTTENPDGGVWTVVRARRGAGPGASWDFGHVCEVLRVERGGDEELLVKHSHNTVLTWDDRGRMTAVCQAGDGDRRNGNIAVRIADPSRYDENAVAYTPAWWLGQPLHVAFGRPAHPAWKGYLGFQPAPAPWGPWNPFYHGAIEGYPGGANISRPAFQGVGAAPGPTPGEVIVAADAQHNPGLVRLDIAASTVEAGWKLTSDQLMLGNSALQVVQSGGTFLCLELRADDPQNPMGWAATVSQSNMSIFTKTRGTLWGEAHEGGVVFGKAASLERSSVYPVGRSLYHGSDTRSGFPDGLLRLDLGGTVIGRPELVGTGASVWSTNAQGAGLAFDPGPMTTVRVVEGAELAGLPARPFQGPVLRVTQAPGMIDRTLFRGLLARADGARWPGPPMHWRLWTLPPSDQSPPQSNPIRFRVQSNDIGFDFERLSAGVLNRWTPVDLYAAVSPGGGPRDVSITAEAGAGSLRRTDIQTDIYLGIDTANVGFGPRSYPAEGPPEGTLGVAAYPGEARRVGGFGSSPEGSLVFAGMLPQDGFDHGYFLRGLRDRVVLWTIASADGGLIEASITPKHRIEVRAVRRASLDGTVGTIPGAAGAGGVQRRVLLSRRVERGDPFLFSVRWSESATTVDVSWSGTERARAELPSGLIGAGAELWLGGDGPRLDASSLQAGLGVFGAAFWPQRLTDAQLEDQLHTLEWLASDEEQAADVAQPWGWLDSGDLMAFIVAFIDRAPLADVTGDGEVDSADLQTFIELFVSGSSAQ